MFIKVTNTFKPEDPRTHAIYSHSERPLGKTYIIETPDKEYEPYDPKKHNDLSERNGIRQGLKLREMSYNQYWRKSNEKIRATAKSKKEAKAARVPTQEEIDIFMSADIDAYLSRGFDPSKGDANNKFNPRLANDLTEILVLSNKIFGQAYEPYIPSKHGTHVEYKSTNLPNFKSARSKARRAYQDRLEKGNISANAVMVSSNPITNTTTSTASRQEVESVGPSVPPNSLSVTPLPSIKVIFNLFPKNNNELPPMISNPSVPNDVPSDQPKRFRPWE